MPVFASVEDLNATVMSSSTESPGNGDEGAIQVCICLGRTARRQGRVPTAEEIAAAEGKLRWLQSYCVVSTLADHATIDGGFGSLVRVALSPGPVTAGRSNSSGVGSGGPPCCGSPTSPAPSPA
eukprot:RCo039083